MAFGFYSNDDKLRVDTPAQARKRRAQVAPEAPALKAPPTRDLQGEASQRLKGALTAAIVSALFAPRRGIGAVASFLKGGQAGADSKFANEVADNQRVNQTAMVQYGANRQRFGDESRLDAMDFQEEQARIGQERWQKGYDRQGEQIQYGRGRDRVGDTRYEEGRQFRDSQFTYNKERDARQFNRQDILDERSASLAALQAMESYGRFIARFDSKSQVSVGKVGTPLLQKLGVQPFAEPLKVAPKPADPYKMGMLNLQIEKLKQLKVWQRGQLGLGQQRNANAAANTGLRAQELGLRGQIAQFNQEMEAVKLAGIEPEAALSLSLRAGALANERGVDPSDKVALDAMSRTLRALAGGITDPIVGSAPAVSPYTLPPGGGSPSFKPTIPPAPTVNMPGRSGGGGFTPPSKKFIVTPTANPEAQPGNRKPIAKPTPKKPAIKSSEKKRMTSGF